MDGESTSDNGSTTLGGYSYETDYEDGSIIQTLNIDAFKYNPDWEQTFKNAFINQLGYLA
jgi:hypothetical protein